MPRYETSVEFDFPVEQVFGVLRRPALRVALAPPDFQLTLIAAPEELSEGARVTVEARRMGLKLQMTSEVRQFQPNARILEAQREGLFNAWAYSQEFTALTASRTRLCEVVEYELPRGMMGLFLTVQVVERETARGMAYRNTHLVKRLTGMSQATG